MKKKKFVRCLAFWLSVVMLVFSLPTAASELEETTMEIQPETVVERMTEKTVTETDGMVVEDYYWKEEQVGAGASTLSLTDDEEGGGEAPTEYSTTFINSDVVPDGVYALRNWGSSTDYEYYYMDIAYGSTVEKNYLQQKPYYTSPAVDFVRRSLFKITRYGDTNYYVIRPMTNNYLSIVDSGDRQYRLWTTEVDPYDDDLSLHQTFSITRTDNYGYVIRPYGSTLAIGATTDNASEANTQYLSLQSASSQNDNTVWELEKFEGGNHSGARITHVGGFVVGDTVNFFLAYPWSTNPEAQYADLQVYYAYSSVATGTWDGGLSKISVLLRDEGQFRVALSFNNIEDVTQIIEYTDYYTTVLPIAEGLYYFQNADLENYMQIDNN